ncbi:MAG: hypothetical protein QOJ02_1022 [Acidobacteriota bacterium]|nr:hypothetical protein [Acidobacteriota bacterium]
MDYNELALESLRQRKEDLKREWASKRDLFGYVVIDEFLPLQYAEEILAAYPKPDVNGWDDTTYIHQRKKLTQTSGFPPPVASFFALTAAKEFRDLLGEITCIPKLIDDPDLIGGGLHQILRGGFLDVHVDYNFHPKNKLYRRLNLLLYLNKDWESEFEGHLELWNLKANHQLEHIAPLFNRAVIFETNEVSYHGHPRPLNTPPHVTRKSLAVYYYTKEHEGAAIAPEHNTLYEQTTGIQGYVKTFMSAMKSASERVAAQGPKALCKNLVRRTYRRLQGLPPENK